MASKAPGFGASHLLNGIFLGACAITLTGCGTLHSARMWFPKASGMDEVDPQLYVEPAMSAQQRHEVQRQINAGRAVVEAFYGEITTKPYFVACLTAECDDRFGSYGQRAAAYGDLAIRLSAKGLSAPVIAHEWSHAELYHRAGGWWYARKIPRWFDEGVAVVVANEPRHSEANWREIERHGLPIPKIDELTSFSDWGAAVKKYGETAGDVPGNLHVVYTTAGHQVRAFLSCAGPTGVATVLGAVRSGTTFDDAYAMVTETCAH
ncbi:MAG: hypothetical protein KGL99_05210 [Burkholderiales bacterium]|nr:hypothetical protein [Burkholderiales bacterium]MDE2299111.1 hypothetical protein [Burkholderiales bacterium]MDE2626532.1 hypothetical protein [Burkholderiales bacterium]